MIVLMLLPFILLYSLIISYFCSVVIYRLCITKKYYNFFFAVLLYVASGISSLLFGFLFCPLFVWYFWRNKIIFVKITLIASVCIMCLGFWQAELPQRLVFKIFTTLQPYPKYEIMPLEVKNDTNASFVDKVSSFRLKNMDKKLPCGLISFYCNIRSIYYSDENIKDFELVKIYGAYFARSTLFNALTIYDASAYEYYGNSDFNEIKKLINKQGEDNVAK
ncbi:hypothetical protein [Campylobacter sp.]|uniref:hypothetical protein n=1 Tax=Campylobacter sp. TaxID=205 RepID=UPI002AA9242F|nr:hypothetical protein [Campylobacter sp.]MCI6662131.1 hypothetical protein [Campylobacter sp.]MCI7549402.1 hypothetical protein [Campylobacter sp.]